MNQGIAIMAVFVALAVGWGTWQKMNAANAKLETKAVRASLTMAEAELQDAAALNADEARKRKDAEAAAKAQAKLAADRAAAERLAWSRVNKLKTEIANVKENPPVPSSIELVLDRLRGAVPGPSGSPADRVDENGDAGTTPVDPNGVPPSTDTATETSVGEHTQR